MTDIRVSETFRKDTVHEAGHGFGRNIGTTAKPIWVAERGINMSSEVVHTTSNPHPDTKPWTEATYLRDSPDVSSHDFIAKNGDVYVILPETMEAWHAGAAVAGFTNRYSFGTELHCSVGETPTQAQIDSLTYRVQQRRAKYNTAKSRIETHRAIALPKGRKSDPEGITDAQFYAWREGLFVSNEPDWVQEWGTEQPYFMGSGIAQAWRDAWRLGTKLGPARTDEFSAAGGRVIRAFDGGYIEYAPQTGTKVRLW